jgi:hypothetical protein
LPHGYGGYTLHIRAVAHPGVPDWKRRELMAAESKGRYIAQHIRKQHPAQ